MKDPIATLTAFRVRDVTRDAVVTLGSQDNMMHAASVLKSNGITGAPVIDKDGACVGIISASDFVGRETKSATVSNATELAFDSMYIKKSYTVPEPIQDNLVEAFMTKNVLTVGVNEPMMRAAQMLCEESVHRLVVVDKQNRPVGIVSALDIIACLTTTIETLDRTST